VATGKGAKMRLFMLRAEALLVLVLALPLVYMLPPRWLQDRLGGFAVPASASGDAHVDLACARDITRRLARIADRLPWKSTCLVRATAGMLLLARRRVAGGRIRLGVRKNDGRLEAHAWLMLGPTILLGGDEADGFTPIADFTR
jgi:hypothetical protein